MIRVAYVINSVEGGGAAAPLPDIIGLLRSRGLAVRIYALTPRDRRALPVLERECLDVAVRAGGESDHWAAFRWLDRQLLEWRPTHIWTSLTRATLIGQMVGLRRHVPVVSWQHAAYLKPANLRLLRAARHLSRLWIGDSECVTELTAERLQVKPSRLLCWPIFPVNTAAPQARPWRPGQRIRIGSLGRLHPVKGYDVLITALAILKAEGIAPAGGYEVAIGGQGPERAVLEAAIAEAGLAHVMLPGFTDRPEDFLAGLHIYVQPSRSEGFCIAAHQAMQAGVPVVASAVGEMQYSVDCRSGAVVPPGDPRALAKALANLLRYPDMLGAMGDAARRRVRRRFGRDAFVMRGDEIVRRISAL